LLNNQEFNRKLEEIKSKYQEKIQDFQKSLNQKIDSTAEKGDERFMTVDHMSSKARAQLEENKLFQEEIDRKSNHSGSRGLPRAHAHENSRNQPNVDPNIIKAHLDYENIEYGDSYSDHAHQDKQESLSGQKSGYYNSEQIDQLINSQIHHNSDPRGHPHYTSSSGGAHDQLFTKKGGYTTEDYNTDMLIHREVGSNCDEPADSESHDHPRDPNLQSMHRIQSGVISNNDPLIVSENQTMDILSEPDMAHRITSPGESNKDIQITTIDPNTHELKMVNYRLGNKKIIYLRGIRGNPRI
jgi:hypothetical protein